MKKTIALLTAVLLLAGLLAGCGGGGKTLTLNVYNWGEYISDGSDDSFNTVKEFEKWYQETTGQRSRSTTAPSPATRTCMPSSRAAR